MLTKLCKKHSTHWEINSSLYKLENNEFYNPSSSSNFHTSNDNREFQILNMLSPSKGDLKKYGLVRPQGASAYILIIKNKNIFTKF